MGFCCIHDVGASSRINQIETPGVLEVIIIKREGIMKKLNNNFFLLFLFLLVLPGKCVLGQTTDPPTQTVKLIFIHHSCGGYWLADTKDINYDETQYGGLAVALMENNYYVSATNYAWGPDEIGERTDVINWQEWFTGLQSESVYLPALFTEYDKNEGEFGSYTRLSQDPGGENSIIMFKSCFPNSDIYGNPADPPLATPDTPNTVSHYKYIYNDLLNNCFARHQDKLFIAITAPPLTQITYEINDQGTPAADRAANIRAFNNWLVHDWLSQYPYNNVAVFDFYNVLTSNGGNADTNDLGEQTGNHHRWLNGNIQHVANQGDNYNAYPYVVSPDWVDEHPTTAGFLKATAEYVPLLNYYYNSWRAAQGDTKGDVDGNGVVDLKDCIQTLRVLTADPGADASRTGDANGDDIISQVEAVFILQYLANL